MANETQTQVETVACRINGIDVKVPKGTRIIEAAEQAGIGIAHYCYHAALSAPAMCRMCLVEIEGVPKLQPACVTPVAEGNNILTESERSREARKGTLEFYLVNHPLDCPICDKSGECRLQDFTHAEGPKHGRSVEAKRVLGQDDFGGDILYDGDRCIMCTRCVRYMREIAQDDRLCVVQRSHRSVIDTFFEHGVEGSPFAGNIVDICPVGALLSKDFLHKARVWDLDHAPSVCASCTQGCNIRIDSRDNLVQRLKPRTNPDVNSYWMCDYGRQNYEWMNQSDRIEAPLVRGADGSHRAQSWQQTVLALLERVRATNGAVTAVGSPYLSNEDNGLLARFATALGGGKLVFRSPRAASEDVLPGFPKLVRRRDLAANVRGLELMGFQRVGDEAGKGGITAASGVVIVMGDAIEDLPADFGRDASLFIYLGHRLSGAARNAHFVLPVTTYAEQEGTFTNFEGRVQRFWPALQPPPLARPSWQVLGVLLAGLEDGQAPADAGSAFLRIGTHFDPFAGLSYDTIGTRGALVNDTVRIVAGKGA